MNFLCCLKLHIPHPALRRSKCYEIRCDPKSFRDNYGEGIDRSKSGVCRNPGASVVFTVTDVCPCDKVENAYSNRRWCCGDMSHVDLSVAAFTQVAYCSIRCYLIARLMVNSWLPAGLMVMIPATAEQATVCIH